MTGQTRRLDWALLLPASAVVPFDEVLVLGGTDEVCQSIVDSGLAASWRRPRDPADRGAFVVAWEDCSRDAEVIARHVLPGGLLYMEVDRHRRGGDGWGHTRCNVRCAAAGATCSRRMSSRRISLVRAAICRWTALRRCAGIFERCSSRRRRFRGRSARA